MTARLEKIRESKYVIYIEYIGVLCLFAIFYGGKMLFENLELSRITVAILLFAYMCLGIKIVLTKYTKKELILGGIVLILCLIAFLHNRNEYIPTNFLLVFSLKNINLRDLLKKAFVVACITVFSVAILSVLGIGGNMCETRNWGRGEETRYMFGFGEPNTMHMFAFRLMVLFVLWKNKMKWYHIVSLLVLNILLFQFTVSRGGLIGGTILILGIITMNILNHFGWKGWYTPAAVILYVLSGCVIFYLVFGLQNSPVYNYLNEVLTGRLVLASGHAQEHPISLWGANFGDIYIDCGWISMILKWGAILFALYQIGMVTTLVKEMKRKQLLIPMIIIVIGLYGICESSVIEKGVAGISLLFLSEALFKDNNWDTMEKDAAAQ